MLTITLPTLDAEIARFAESSAPAITRPTCTRVSRALIRLSVLDTIATTPDALADFLHRRGYLGTPGRPDRCPVSRYLVNGRADVSVRVGTGRLGVTGIPCNHHVCADLPGEVAEFVARFDGGHYATLVERS